MSIEAMKLALEALEAFLRFAAIHHDGPDTSDKYLAEDYAVEGFRKARQVLPALRTAIAEAESVEPVDFLDWYDNAIWGNEDFKAGCWRAWDAALEHAAPAAQRQWVDLTDDDLIACSPSQKTTVIYFVKKFKEKNT